MDTASILIVDDNPANLSILGQILAHAGYRVRPANSGKMALAAVEFEPVELILLDIIMPMMNGFEVCKTLKSNPATAMIPVIFLSALTDTQDKIKGFECGCLDYIAKPFNDLEVLARVKTHVQLYRLQRELQDYNAKLETEVQRRTASLHESTQGLQRALAAKRDFLMLMSHEFRTPLNAILGMSCMLKNELTTDKHKHYSEIIEESGWRLFKLVDDILTVIQQSNTPPQLAANYQAVDMARLCHSIIASDKKLIAEKNLHVDLVLGDMPQLEIPMSLPRLRHIIDNVLDNALKYTPQWGQIAINVQYEREFARLFIEVADSGAGISRADRQRIFEAFVQLEPVLSRAHEGSGLGLTLTKNLLSLHGGTIEVFDSELGGAAFHISLPAKILLETPDAESIRAGNRA